MLYLFLSWWWFLLAAWWNTDNIEIAPNRLQWSKERRLEWSDFQAAPPETRYLRIAALTSSLIQYRYFCTPQDTLQITIKAVFLKDESWVRPLGKTTDCLRHEQTHFDITELYARRLKHCLAQRTYTCRDVAILEAEVKKILDEWRDTQLRFDDETHYSLHTIAQKNWESYIAECLSLE